MRYGATRTLQLARKSVETIRRDGWRRFYYKVRRKLAGQMPLPEQPHWREGYTAEALGYAEWLDFTPEQLRQSRELTAAHAGPIPINTINWYLPHFEHAYYGGVLTVFRFAANFAWYHQVANRFVIISHPNGPSAEQYRERISDAFPELRTAQVFPVRSNSDLAAIPPSDAVAATSWITAYYALKDNNTKRKFYFLQDFEPIFHAAGSTSAQAEATYRFGFYGLTNTISLKKHYEADYGGQATYFTPSIDPTLFHPPATRNFHRQPYRVFFYARPDHWRNGFELGAIALIKLKQQLGAKVQILAAGQNWSPARYGLEGVVEPLGLMSYQQTAELYRTCDIGLAMMFTRHPSYLPFEFMASGFMVVSNVNHETSWFLKDGENCLLAMPSASSIAATIARGLEDAQLRQQITERALRLVREQFADWNSQIERVYAYMCDPQAAHKPEPVEL